MGDDIVVRSRYRELTIGSDSGLRRMEKIAGTMAQSGAFKDSRQASQAFAKLAIGEELGVGPAAAMSQIYLFDGKVTFGASLIASLVKQSGRYKYRIKQSDTEVCEIHWFERDELGEWEDVGVSSFTVEEAKAAGLMSKNNWKAYTSDMLFARALTRGARRYAPDVFGGGSVYTPEEIGVPVTDEGEAIIDEGEAIIDEAEVTGPVRDIPRDEPVVEQPPTPEESAKRAISTAREKFGKENADKTIRVLLQKAFDGKKFADLSNEEYVKFAVLVNEACSDKGDSPAADDEPEDVEFEEIPGDQDAATGRAYDVTGSRGAKYQIVVYPDGAFDCSCPARKPECKHVLALRRPFLDGNGGASGWLWPGDDGYDSAPTGDSEVAAKVERSLEREKQAASEPAVVDEPEADGSPDPDAGPLDALIAVGVQQGLTQLEAMQAIADAGVGSNEQLSSPSGNAVARGALATAARRKRGEPEPTE